MSWTAPRTWVAGETVTPAIMNTHVRDNLLEPGPAKVTTQGDLLYATAANTLARLAKGTASQFLRMNSGATEPEWATAPLFMARRSSKTAGVTGNGTAYVVLFDTADISHAGYATGTGIFTVPAGEGGKYLFICQLGLVAGGSAQTNGIAELITTAKTSRVDFDPYTSRNTATGIFSPTLSIVVNLAAGDTAKVQVTIGGGPSNTAIVVGNTNAFSHFAGFRIG